jgi:meso-butanediol dehydrogenase/(S,S)-butanediol dehydrogenase/diacetyl reductase
MKQGFFSDGLLKNRVALVTGAGGAIGRGIASELAGAGAAVVLVDVNEVENPHNQFGSSWTGGFESALRCAEELKKNGGTAEALECDITGESRVREMVRTVVDRFGRIEILVNNAGVLTMAPVTELKAEEWDHVMDLNAKGCFFCCKHVAPVMIRQEFGRIINISSTSGLKGYAGQGHYCASKFAIIGFSQTLALELAPHGITVNAVCPGIISSQMWKFITGLMKSPGETNETYFQKAIDRFIPLRRAQTPEDIGKTVTFVAAMENITGASIPVSGGLHINSPSLGE